MSLLAELRPKKGSRPTSKRLGRGEGSGKGKTAAKGHKGQKARSGGKVMWGFEGGHMPLQMRLPKFGFISPFRKQYSIVNIKQLERFDGEVTPDLLRKSGLAKKNRPVKILGDGQLAKSLTVKAHKFSQTARSSIEAAGGKVEVI